jgi:uncharacterized protein YjbJ (UPF0337 family)
LHSPCVERLSGVLPVIILNLVEREFGMDVTLNKDIMVGKWEQIKSRVKQRWGRINDDQLDRISGNYDELAGLIRERYGYTHEKARKDVDEFIQKLDLLDQ